MRAPARPAAYRAVLGNRPFVALWLGKAVSTFGDALYDLALLWYVLDATGSALDAAGIAVAAGGGRLLGSLAAGLLLDRLPARRVMLACEATRAALTAALGMAWLAGSVPSLALLYGLALALACGGALFGPARLATIPRLVPRAALITANALDQFSASLVSTLAWGASGAIVAVVGPARGLLLDAATFLASLVALAWLPQTDAADERGQETGLLGGLVVGARWLRDDRLGRAVLAAQLAQAAMNGAFFAGIGPHLARNLGGGAATYGVQGAVYGLALMLGSWAIGRAAVRRVGLLYALGFVVNGAGNSGFALAPSLGALLPAVAVAGLGAAAFITGEITLLQLNIPAALRGRVIALTVLLATAVGIASLALGGWLADHAPVRAVLLVTAVGHGAIGVALLAQRRVRDAATGSPTAH